jgi:peptide/nickel transport system substrate-binding protein
MSRPISRRAVLQSSMAAAMMAGAPSIVAGQAPRVLRVRMANDLVSLDPVITRSLTDICAIIGVLNKLVVYKSTDKWEWRLDAARSIEQVDPAHVKFTLRPGIMWTNGFGEMTAEDVKYSFERMIDPKLKSNNAPDWKLLDRVDVVDKYSGVIVLKAPFPGLFLGTLTRSAGTIVSKKAVESVGGSYKTEPPATSGPYLLKEWRPKDRIVLARNPQWNGPRPEFDEVHIRPIGDQKAAELGYEAGEIDVTDIAVSNDGTRVYVTGIGRNGAPGYDGPLTIAYDAQVGGPSLWEHWTVGPTTGWGGYAVAVSPDGSKVFMTGRANKGIRTEAYLTS